MSRGAYAVILRRRRGQRFGFELVLPVVERQHLCGLNGELSQLMAVGLIGQRGSTAKSSGSVGSAGIGTSGLTGLTCMASVLAAQALALARG